MNIISLNKLFSVGDTEEGTWGVLELVVVDLKGMKMKNLLCRCVDAGALGLVVLALGV